MIKNKNKNKNILNPSKLSFRVDPHKHWKLLLKIFMALSIILVSFGLYIFYQINQEQIFRVETIEPTKGNTLKEKLLEEIIISFEEKNVNRSIVEDGKADFIDPSN